MFALQESEGLTTTAALARLGMDSAVWLIQRTALSVYLVCLAGWTRYHAPAPDVALEAEVERRRLEADLLFEPLCAQKRIMQARGLHGVLAATIGRDPDPNVIGREANPVTGDNAHGVPAPSHPQKPPQKPPTGPGTPVAASKRRTPGSKRAGSTGLRVLRTGTAEEHIRQAVAQHPTISVRTLAKRAGVAESSASKWLQVIQADQSLQQTGQAVQ